MIEIELKSGELDPAEQNVITAGFVRHTQHNSAPLFEKQRINWLAYDDNRSVIGALTADVLWDWIYIDELWVSETARGRGLGGSLMAKAEAYAASSHLTGLWLWTQSWQAADFYKRLGYLEFARFPDFPKGHFRVGLRKQLNSGPGTARE